ncbi:hypothetical protein [Anoxynatronum buryatiense]|uniref:Uncharacterized protein n=1 Tax=Anoxynatronum buryatiense TaxID=489973 RepID=A0AA45WTY7_9CLOT|nr:hypothetical protein [Anoxynatronum buryatiense]SMP44077.1 hypothetical protein SAMN06296020_102125 [Anoxynatronum buryatiense]
MRVRLVVALAIFILAASMAFAPVVAESDGVQIKDPALEAFIRREIDKPEGVIQSADVEGIRTIDTTT